MKRGKAQGSANKVGSVRDEAERAYWRDSSYEGPGAFSAQLLTHKMTEAKVLLEKLDLFADQFDAASTVLEIGGGQGWASCFVKDRYPHVNIVTSDLSPEALYSRHAWERVIGTNVDGAAAARVDELPFRTGSIDLVFAFAAAHHFDRMPAVLSEIRRVLSDSGVALFLHEPSCPAWVYRPAYWRVNRKRPEVPEDVIQYREMESLAAAAGLATTTMFAPTTTARGAVETVYYLGLRTIKPLQRCLPCTADFVMRPMPLAPTRTR